MKKLVYFSLITCLILVALAFYGPSVNFHAQENSENLVYIIYDENNNILFERQNVVVGDEYIDNNLRQYIIYELNQKKQTGKAKLVAQLDFPKLKKKINFTKTQQDKVIGLYMTHNDESYVTGDGYDSIYGAGGIHGIARQLKTELDKYNNITILDETLHVPHDIYAYDRSAETANTLIDNYSPDALFDIHRDGASRSTYVSTIDNEDKCKVRIVVGKANAEFERIKTFALYMVSVANELHDWLFLDIYLAKNHYNQDLTDNTLLFEMGSHLVEKDLVEKTVPALAEVINTTLNNMLNIENTGDSPFVSDQIDNQVSTSPVLPPEVVLNQTDNVSGDKFDVMYFLIYIIIMLSAVSGVFFFKRMYLVKK